MKNNKGFTLIELMATIIILSLILGIAIPSVSTLVKNSRKKAFYTSVSNIIDSISSKAINNNSSKCLYAYDDEKDKLPSDISQLYVLVRFEDDSYIYGVYAEHSTYEISIDIDDFSKTKIDDFNSWKKEFGKEGSASRYISKLVSGFTENNTSDSFNDDILEYEMCETIS